MSTHPAPTPGTPAPGDALANPSTPSDTTPGTPTPGDALANPSTPSDTAAGGTMPGDTTASSSMPSDAIADGPDTTPNRSAICETPAGGSLPDSTGVSGTIGDTPAGGKGPGNAAPGHRPARRTVAICVVTAVLLAAAGLTVWRVLRPSEAVITATQPYPELPLLKPGRIGVLISAPLIVDDRIRVFAKTREVWSDIPPNYHYERSAYWSYRRWPAQLTGVVLAPSAAANTGSEQGRTIVVTAWSDGMIVGIDARTGAVSWRFQGDPLASEYTGRRTGAATIYEPQGTFTTSSAIVTSSANTLRGIRSDGTQAWERPTGVIPNCRGTEFTTETQWQVLDTCARTIRRVDTTTGTDLPAFGAGITKVEPVSCAIGNSRCQAIRTHTGTTTQGWSLNNTEPGAEPVATAALTQPGALFTNGIVIIPNHPTAASTITAVNPATGDIIWTWQSPAPARLLSADKARIFLLTNDRTLISLSPRTGADLTRTGMNLLHEPETPYEIRHFYAAGPYIVLERINPGTPESAPDDQYYFTHRPTLIAVG